MDQISDDKNTDEQWLEEIAIKEAMRKTKRAGKTHCQPALFLRQNPNGGSGRDRHFPSPGFQTGKGRFKAVEKTYLEKRRDQDGKEFVAGKPGGYYIHTANSNYHHYYASERAFTLTTWLKFNWNTTKMLLLK
jgi:hypothetical protein